MNIVDQRDYQKGIQIGNNFDSKQKQKTNYDSVNDPRLGSAVFNDNLCPTCNSDFKECMGHFGKVKLQQAVINPLFKDKIQHLLQIFCQNCFKVLLKNYAKLNIVQLIIKSKFI